MTLRLTQLESRECPVFLGSRNGYVLAADNNDFVPFSDFMAAHATAGDQFVTVVGAANGGGPRVQVREEGRVVADFFAYETEFRGGVNVAYENGLVAVGAGTGGGPVVAVYDIKGNEISRWFAYDHDFRGGVSVAIRNGVVYAAPGTGGGPHVKSFDLDGTVLSSFFGADPEGREGYQVILGDATGDGIEDVTLAGRHGRISITDGLTGFYARFNLPTGYTLAGYEGRSISVGHTDGYLRARALWTSFPTMTAFDEFDAGAGNPNLPPSTGTRPGVYRPIATVSGSCPPSLDGMETFGTVYASGSVGTAEVGTGSSYVPMQDGMGRVRLVTASHVTRRSPFANSLPQLLAPGRLDGVPQPVGMPVSVSTIPANGPYTVDAAAFNPVGGLTLSRDVSFNSETVPLAGVADTVASGDLLVAVGRGKFLGTGTAWGYQTSPVPIRWPSGEVVSIADQIIGVGGPLRLAEPGFSGGVVFRAAFVGDNQIERELVGMTVAGNSTTVFITPHSMVEAALGLTWQG